MTIVPFDGAYLIAATIIVEPSEPGSFEVVLRVAGVEVQRYIVPLRGGAQDSRAEWLIQARAGDSVAADVVPSRLHTHASLSIVRRLPEHEAAAIIRQERESFTYMMAVVERHRVAAARRQIVLTKE